MYERTVNVVAGEMCQEIRIACEGGEGGGVVKTVGQCDGPGTQARVRTTKFVQDDGCYWLACLLCNEDLVIIRTFEPMKLS